MQRRQLAVTPVELEAITFDLFNTLVGIKPIEQGVLAEVLSRELAKMGFKKRHVQIVGQYMNDVHQHFLDRQTTHVEFNNAIVLQQAIKSVAGMLLPLQHCNEIIDSYFSTVHTFIFEEVPYVLETLSKRYPLYVVSNHSWPEAVHEAVKPIRRYFKKIIISGDVGWRKPSKIIFSPIIKRHGTKVVHCGDHGQEDIDAVYPLGWKAIWVKRKEQCPPPTIFKHLLATVHDLRETLEVIP